MAQTPQQRRANAKFVKDQEARRGKSEDQLKKKVEKAQKSPISPIWLGVLAFIIIGGKGQGEGQGMIEAIYPRYFFEPWGVQDRPPSTHKLGGGGVFLVGAALSQSPLRRTTELAQGQKSRARVI
ncbi:hypothetical protein B0T22DRAFT_207615 [Podospora appendiculata]|uniref:Stress-associated endoplasmic reticulum protein n=1 Tax=Podospora appendiculata TaxID=314037 RepID=A0AAE1CA06_9PEZI|nr:hypothetical protein B0T22DRAFT_207615 [Podospora appendiculata]